jgi:hypothetical protein
MVKNQPCVPRIPTCDQTCYCQDDASCSQ